MEPLFGRWYRCAFCGTFGRAGGLVHHDRAGPAVYYFPDEAAVDLFTSALINHGVDHIRHEGHVHVNVPLPCLGSLQHVEDVTWHVRRGILVPAGASLLGSLLGSVAYGWIIGMVADSNITIAPFNVSLWQ